MTATERNFRRCHARVERLSAELAVARFVLRFAENALSDSLGYRVPVRGPALLATIDRAVSPAAVPDSGQLKMRAVS